MSKYPALDKVLNDAEKTKLRVFSTDETMANAVKKVVLFGIYYNGTLKAGEEPDPTRNFALSLMAQSRSMPDEHLGRVLRAQMEAISLIKDGFDKIDEISERNLFQAKKKDNPAR